MNKIVFFSGFILLVLLLCPTVTAYDERVMEYYNEGNNLLKLGRLAEAVASYDMAIAIDPNYSMAWNNRGLALYYLGRYTEAVASYDKAIAINPNDASAIKNRHTAIDKQIQSQQTKSTPLLYAPIGAIVLMAGIAVWSRHRSL